MPLTLQQSTAPTSEPVTMYDLKSYLRIEHDEEDILLSSLQKAARLDVERFMRRQIMTATWKLYLDGWPRDNIIRLPRPPLQSIASVVYVDSDGIPQTLSSSLYQVDSISEPGRLMPAYGEVWPTLRGETFNAVTITYLAGWTTQASVPDGIRIAIMMLAGDMYEHRESQLEAKVEGNPTVERLLWNYRFLEAA